LHVYVLAEGELALHAREKMQLSPVPATAVTKLASGVRSKMSGREIPGGQELFQGCTGLAVTHRQNMQEASKSR